MSFRRHDAPPYVDDSGEPDVPPIHLVVRISPQARLRAEDYFDAEAMTLLEDGHLLATADWPEDEWVYETILSFGEHAVVLEPPHVRQRVRDSLRKTLAAYET
jgi:predicted DNA-binding transcriptional regulator YafY